MTDSVCFVANFSKTYFFHEVSLHLKNLGVNVFWITVNQKLRDFLVQHYGENRILYLSKHNASHNFSPVGEYSLNELIYGDRVLRYEPSWGSAFLRNIQQPFYDFVQNNNIRFVFGELTWAHEILFHRILQKRHELHAKYLSPFTIRIPNGRFGFFTDEWQSELYENPSQTSIISHKTRSTELTAEKPDYLIINDTRIKESRKLKNRASRIGRFISKANIDDFDPTVTASRWISFRKHATEEFNREAYRFIKTKKLNKESLESKFIFIPLHKQPEASIDVIGRFYEDQFLNILNIWRILPDGWRIYVKEHTNAIGDRSPLFYRKISNLKNVDLIDEKTDSHLLIKNAMAVVTVSGTAAYEAALLGVPSYTFAPTFFNRFPLCNRINIDMLRESSGIEIFNPNRNASNDDAISFLFKNSFPGVISDPISNPSCMSPDNVKDVADAFVSLLIS